jgi:osmoprotectant transport system permease protein
VRPATSGAGDVMPLAAEAGLNPWFSLSWVIDNWSLIVPLLVQHVRLTVVSVLIGALVAFPLALLARRNSVLSGAVLGMSTLVYTIPSLAMFAFVSPFTGLSETTVAIGLVLYSLVILVRNFLAGLQAVPADAREAARGMGYGSARLLWQVELPLALPSIFTGLRIATVSTVALVTVGVIVGQGGLGQIIIVNGFGANYYRPPIVFGTLACVLLALVADQLLALAQRLLTPWARTRVAA